MHTYMHIHTYIHVYTHVYTYMYVYVYNTLKCEIKINKYKNKKCIIFSTLQEMQKEEVCEVNKKQILHKKIPQWYEI